MLAVERGDEGRSEECAERRPRYSHSRDRPEDGARGRQSTSSLEPDALQMPLEPLGGHVLGGMRTSELWREERGGAEPTRAPLAAEARTAAGSRCNWRFLSPDERIDRGKNEYAGRLTAEARAETAEARLRASTARVAKLEAQIGPLQVGWVGVRLRVSWLLP